MLWKSMAIERESLTYLTSGAKADLLAEVRAAPWFFPVVTCAKCEMKDEHWTDFLKFPIARLRRTCNRCGYEWHEKPLDWTEPS
jgi:hypothetical protein